MKKRIIRLIMGTVFAQIIVVIASPLLTRLYSPQEFGELAIFTLLVAILSVIASFRLDVAIFMGRDDKEKRDIVLTGVSLSLIFNIILLLILTYIKYNTNLFYQYKTLGEFYYLIPISVFGLSTYNLLTNYSIKNNDIQIVNTSKINRSIFLVVTQILISQTFLKYAGLLIGDAISRISGSYRMTKKFLFDGKNHRISIVKIKAVLIEYKRYLVISTWGGLLTVLNNQLLVVILPFFYNSSIVGFYALSVRIVNAPLVLISKTVGQIFQKEFAEAEWAERKRVLLKLISVQTVVGLIIFSPLLFFGKEIFSFIFGNEWSEAGKFIQILSFMLILEFVAQPLLNLLEILNRHYLMLFWNVGRIIVISTITIIVTIYSSVIEYTLIAYSITSFVMFLMIIVIVTKVTYEGSKM